MKTNASFTRLFPHKLKYKHNKNGSTLELNTAQNESVQEQTQSTDSTNNGASTDTNSSQNELTQEQTQSTDSTNNGASTDTNSSQNELTQEQTQSSDYQQRVNFRF
ncbi:hypothetical protein Tco_1023201 [Tanacetum coccineum]